MQEMNWIINAKGTNSNPQTFTGLGIDVSTDEGLVLVKKELKKSMRAADIINEDLQEEGDELISGTVEVNQQVIARFKVRGWDCVANIHAQIGLGWTRVQLARAELKGAIAGIESAQGRRAFRGRLGKLVQKTLNQR
jgi:hypothetical protein